MKAALLCFTDYRTEPRVLRTIDALKDQFQIDVIETIQAGNKILHVSELNYDIIDVPAKGWLFQKFNSLVNKLKGRTFNSQKYFDHKYWSHGRTSILKKISNGNYSLVIGHGIYTVPILASLPSTTKKVFNAHEFYEREFEENNTWTKYSQPYYRYILSTYLKKIDLMLCVCQTIQDDYQKLYPIKSIVQTNARNYVNLSPSAVNEEKIQLVHHGAALRGRNLEKTIEVINLLPPNYELHLILIPSDETYYIELKNRYGSNSRISFHRKVEIDEIPAFINQFDIGIYILPPTNYNNLAALPNKFFDFIQARLCIAVSPNIEMKNLIEEFELGVVSPDFETATLANEIKKLSVADIARYKNNCHKHALDFSAEKNKILVSETIVKLVEATN